MIARLSEAMGAALINKNLSPNPSNFGKFHFISKKKFDSSRPDIYKAMYPCGLSN